MSEHPQHSNNGGFEREDLGARNVYAFLIILALVGLVVYFVVNATYRGLNGYFQAHQPQQTALKPMTESDPRATQTSRVERQISDTFPQPLLENDERNELNDFRRQEEKQLNSYGWVDQKAGVVHVPIERAMQLMAERGLPVRPQGEPKLAVVKKQ